MAHWFRLHVATFTSFGAFTAEPFRAFLLGGSMIALEPMANTIAPV